MKHSERYEEYLRNGYLYDGANAWFVFGLVLTMIAVAYWVWDAVVSKM